MVEPISSGFTKATLPCLSDLSISFPSEEEFFACWRVGISNSGTSTATGIELQIRSQGVSISRVDSDTFSALSCATQSLDRGLATSSLVCVTSDVEANERGALYLIVGASQAVQSTLQLVVSTDLSDAEPSDNSAFFSFWPDFDYDGDGLSALIDPDDDNDGADDSEDAFPDDANEQLDTDGDGIGDNADSDDDGDGIVDWENAFPENPTEQFDTDLDGIGDNTDADDDGDGLSDTEELARGLDPLIADSDGDLISDAEELARGLNPLATDSDRGSIPDGEELELGLYPLGGTCPNWYCISSKVLILYRAHSLSRPPDD